MWTTRIPRAPWGTWYCVCGYSIATSMKKLFVLTLALLLLAPAAHAQEPVPGMAPPGKTPLRALRENAEIQKQKIQEIKQEVRENRTDALEMRKETKQDAILIKQKALETNKGIRMERQEFTKATIEERRALQESFKAQITSASSPEERRALIETAHATRLEFRERIKSDAETMRIDFKTRREGVREEAQNLAGEYARNVLRRLLNALDDFESLLSRIDSRIVTLQESGVDTAAAEVATATAGAAMDAAATAIADAQSALEAAAASETPRDEMGSVREAVTTAVDAVKTAHQALREALQSLKGLASPPDDSDDTDATPEDETEVEDDAEEESDEPESE